MSEKPSTEQSKASGQAPIAGGTGTGSEPQNTPSEKARAFSVKQVAEWWGVSARHVHDLCAQRKLGHLRIGSLIRIRIADIEIYESQQWRAPQPRVPVTQFMEPVSREDARRIRDQVCGEINPVYQKLLAGGRKQKDAFKAGQRSAASKSDSR